MTTTTATKTSKTFHLPTKPLSLIDCINRTAAGTGSFRYAMACTNADYNGHHVTTCRTIYGYYVATYFWGGSFNIARGSFAEVAASVKSWYESEKARGTGATISVEGTEEEVAAGEKVALDLGFVAGLQPNCMTTDPLKAEIHSAFSLEKWGLVPTAVSMLANSKTIEEYKAKKDAYIKERAEENRKAREAAELKAELVAFEAEFDALQDTYDEFTAALDAARKGE